MIYELLDEIKDILIVQNIKVTMFVIFRECINVETYKTNEEKVFINWGSL